MGEIYKVTSPNQKAYIGQAVYKLNNIKGTIWGGKRRWEAHIHEAYRKPKNECIYLNNAIRKYGEDAFEFEIIHSADTIEELNKVEERLIIEHNTLIPNGYNMRKGGYNKQWTDDVKFKIRETNTGQSRSDYTKSLIKEKAKTRPCKYTDDFVQTVLTQLKLGKSKTEVSSEYNVPLSTLRSWLNCNRRYNRTHTNKDLIHSAHEKSSLFHNSSIKTMIIEKLTQGITIKDLSEEYNVPNQTISDWRKKQANLQTRQHTLHPEEIKLQVIEFVKSGHSKAEASCTFNVPAQTVSRWTLQT